MTTKFKYAIILLLAGSFGSCNDDNEAPKTVPVVSTGVATNVTMTTATLGGTIMEDGNDVITTSGVVYSSNVTQPTIVDNKVETDATSGTFTINVTGLSSGTTYHVRAFATNSIGTSYGEVQDFSTGNASPFVTEVMVDGSLEVNKTVTAKYKYNDSENDIEAGTTFQWYVATSSSGAGETAIAGATEKTLNIADSENGKFLRVSVTPKAASGTLIGQEAKSPYSAAVGAETVTFAYDGGTVTYGTIISAQTQRKWLDRALGAKHAAQSVDDYEAYGDLFQWGRLADGHQKILRTDATDAGASGVAGTTNTLSPTDIPATTAFIIPTGVPYDWRATRNNNLWQGVNGTNNPCPTGWRVPTQDEWEAEQVTTLNDGFSKLGLTYTGYHNVGGGNFQFTDSFGMYWSSTVTTAAPEYAVVYILMPDDQIVAEIDRGNGYACRCIKN